MPFKKGDMPWNKGLNKSWNKGLTKETDERIRKQSDKMKDRTLSEDHKKKISKSEKNKKVSKETGRLISKANKGNNNGRWKGGGPSYWSKKLKKIYKECVLCKSDYKLEMHHKDKDRYNNERSNLIILCQHCHRFWHRK